MLVALTLGVLAFFAPAPVVEARECVYCPLIYIECGPCYERIPQTCNRCAYCKRIPGCNP